MRPDLTVVFPQASTAGGTERVMAELLRFSSSRRPTRFIGERCEVPDVAFVEVQPARTPSTLRPWAFRRAATRALEEVEPGTVVSSGVQCPPGDVLWVHSVHRAWVDNGGEVRFRGIRVPSQARRLRARHQILLRLEHEYFTRQEARAILVTSHRELEDLERYYSVPRDLMHVVPNGFDPDVFRLGRRAERAVARREISATEDDIVVLLVANEWNRKGLGALIRAVAALDDRRMRIDLVGRKDPADYRRLARRLGIGDRVFWHGASRDVARSMVAADIFAMPTTYEPFGNVIIEAMACGVPVVTSRLAGASSAIDHGADGLLLDDPRDVGEVSAALAALLDPSARDAMGHAASEAVADYRWSAVMERAEAIMFGRGAAR